MRRVAGTEAGNLRYFLIPVSFADIIYKQTVIRKEQGTGMTEHTANAKMVTKLLFRLLPIQILRIKDDCVPFDPTERQKMADAEDKTKNIGIRMVFRMASEVRYQNILGLNVLTVRIGRTE